uniref:Oocyst wall protein n=1 Tax=Romanomermis culicivorax TaxID=13658 RepID=A0A915HTY7_ROMCU
ATAFTDTIIQDKVPDNEAYITSVPSADPTKEPRKCPEVHIPILQPGCRLLPAKYDSAGCRLLPEVTCDPTIVSRPKNTLECPKLVLPTMDPLCSFGPSRNDSNGCPMVPEVFCPSDLGETEVYTTEMAMEKVTVRVPPTSDPKMLSHCPYIPPPYLPPGCMYGVARYDSDGCSIAPEVICPRIDGK